MRRIFRTRDYDPDADRDLADELRAHLELKVEDLVARGLSEEDAWAEARRSLEGQRPGHTAAARAARSSLRRRTLLDRVDTLVQDVRYALRRMLRSPGFTAVAVVSLGIGVGANTAVFSVVNAFLIRKTPYPAAEELVRVYTDFSRVSPSASTSYRDFVDIRDMDGVFTGAGATEFLMTVAEFGGEPERVLVEAMSADLMPVLGVEPVLGRRFLPEEDATPGANAVVILGYAFWQQAFSGDPGVLGRTLTMAARPFTIVGVAPEWFNGTAFTGLKMDVFVPVSMSAAIGGRSDAMYERRSVARFDVMARLAPGVTVEDARARLDVLASQLVEAYPEDGSERSFRVMPAGKVALSPEIDQGMHLTAVFLAVVVGLVLLLACTNLASFLLARGVERQKEVAMRLALGAGRTRLIRQLLTETILLGLMGGAAGLLLARVTLDFVVAYQPPIPVTLSLDLGLDGRVFLFTLGISALAGLVFGLAPALQSTRPELAPTLKDGGVPNPRKRLSLQTGLVALQMMVSMILLVGGGLFLRSLVAAQSIDPGFSTAPAGIAWLDLRASRLPEEEWDRVRVRLEERLRAEPGVQTVASAGDLPLSLGSSYQTLDIPGREPPPGAEGHRLEWTQVSPGYFEAMGIPILAGRGVTADDRAETESVVVVSEAMATRFWPGDSPLGRQIFRSASRTPLTVVGVVRDVKVSSLGEVPRPFLYFPTAQSPPFDLQILVRGPVAEATLVATLRRVIKAVDPNLVVMEIKTMDEHLSVRLFGPRAAAALLGLFGVLALLLSSIGLYGVVSFSVSRRVHEMGIRISLGADAGQVTRMVVGRALGVVVVGGAVGLGAAFALANVVRVFLVGVSPADPVTLVGIPLLLGSVALVAALIPARRASRVSPMEALRGE